MAVYLNNLHWIENNINIKLNIYAIQGTVQWLFAFIPGGKVRPWHHGDWNANEEYIKWSELRFMDQQEME